MKIWWTILILSLTIKSTCCAQTVELNDSINTDHFPHKGVPIIEVPFTILPFARGDLHFPVGKQKEDMPYIGIGGGNYLLFPSEYLKMGILAGFSFGEYRKKSFSGYYTYQGTEQFLRLEMNSRLRNFRFGIKVVNHTSNKRIKPYTELYISRMTMFTNFSVDEKRVNESTPMIETMGVEHDHTRAYHINSGFEINLLKKKNLQHEKYKGQGIFLNVALGYAHGVDPVIHLDVTRARTNPDINQESDLNYVKFSSQETDFSTFVPQFESKLRYLNLSFELVFRF